MGTRYRTAACEPVEVTGLYETLLGEADGSNGSDVRAYRAGREALEPTRVARFRRFAADNFIWLLPTTLAAGLVVASVLHDAVFH